MAAQLSLKSNENVLSVYMIAINKFYVTEFQFTDQGYMRLDGGEYLMDNFG